jgi:hypothetical protein
MRVGSVARLGFAGSTVPSGRGTVWKFWDRRRKARSRDGKLTEGRNCGLLLGDLDGDCSGFCGLVALGLDEGGDESGLYGLER